MGNKKFDTALDRLLKVEKKYPKNLGVVFSLCTVYSKKGYYTTAIGHCERALLIDPQDLEIMNRLAWLYAKKKTKLDRGLGLIKTVTTIEPNSPKYIDTFSELLFAKGDIIGAVKNIKEAIRLDPTNKYYKQQMWRFNNFSSDAFEN